MHAGKMSDGYRTVSEMMPKPMRRQRYEGRTLPPLGEVPLDSLRIDRLRQALRTNAISFPSQVPIFDREDRPDLQRKIAQLFFVLGWSCGQIAVRYGVVRSRVGQILKKWTRCALEMGYIQLIPPADAPVLLSATARDRASEPASHPVFWVSPRSLERTL